MESKLEQYSKRSKGNRGKVSEQTITSAKEKKRSELSGIVIVIHFCSTCK